MEAVPRDVRGGGRELAGGEGPKGPDSDVSGQGGAEAMGAEGVETLQDGSQYLVGEMGKGQLEGSEGSEKVAEGLGQDVEHEGLTVEKAAWEADKERWTRDAEALARAFGIS